LNSARLLLPGDALDGGDVLPGFQMAVSELFRRPMPRPTT
jgi:hypothetical protein